MALSVHLASSPRDYADVRVLWREYAQFLLQVLGPAHICLGDFEAMLDRLPEPFAPPLGCIAIAVLHQSTGTDGDSLAGCAALRPFAPARYRGEAFAFPSEAEIKRLWVRPGARGGRVGRELLSTLIAFAKEQGYHSVLLDSVRSSMPEAIHLYRRLGFQETERYNDNTAPDLVYLKLDLRSPV